MASFMIYRMGQLAAPQAAWSYDHTKPTGISICNEDSVRDNQGTVFDVSKDEETM